MRETDLENLHTRIKKARTDNNLYLYNVSDYVGVSRQTLSYWESGDKSVPTIAQLDKISKVTGYPLEYFLYADVDLNEALLIEHLRKKAKQLATITIDINKLLNK